MEDGVVRARETLARALGRQSAFWGLGRTAGEMYAVLYLSLGPVSLEDLARSLGVTKGNVSVAIRQLEQLGMVRRSWNTGDRRVFFEAETDFWKIARSVLGLRQKPEFDQSFALVEEAARLLEQVEPTPERDHARQRLEALREFYGLLDSLVEMALGMAPDALKAMVEMLRGLGADANRLKEGT
ncbi:MAG: MarR family transcriptional regulator [Dehalococcoidia bacterium]|nr:MarR family transcriptional regulator [Dehalococcoidia bacterium]